MSKRLYCRPLHCGGYCRGNIGTICEGCDGNDSAQRRTPTHGATYAQVSAVTENRSGRLPWQPAEPSGKEADRGESLIRLQHRPHEAAAGSQEHGALGVQA